MFIFRGCACFCFLAADGLDAGSSALRRPLAAPPLLAVDVRFPRFRVVGFWSALSECSLLISLWPLTEPDILPPIDPFALRPALLAMDVDVSDDWAWLFLISLAGAVGIAN